MCLIERRNHEQAIALSLGHRAELLFAGALVATAWSGVAGMVVLRALIEVGIFAGWLGVNPSLQSAPLAR